MENIRNGALMLEKFNSALVNIGLIEIAIDNAFAEFYDRIGNINGKTVLFHGLTRSKVYIMPKKDKLLK